MFRYRVYVWQQAPAIRLLLPFVAGILLQWYLPLSLTLLLVAFTSLLLLTFLFSFLLLAKQYRLRSAGGLLMHGLLVLGGMWLVWTKDIRNNGLWIGTQYKPGDYVVATLQEPLLQKEASFKALAQVEYRYSNNKILPLRGRCILYFKLDAAAYLNYGTQLLIFKPLQEIKNSGNPESFDYKQYSLFNGITHQVYLTNNDFALLPQEDKTALSRLVFWLRIKVLGILKTYIRGAKEVGLAEALLIGYKNDLDKTLVQAYSNTGVVHLIAISGLHVGLIYALLLFITKPLRHKKLMLLRMLVVMLSIWLFALLAGAQPSVLRSAVMFSFLLLATVWDKRTSVYNTLALSAIALLLYNPFWLWDTGFQLSYTAVLSLMLFYKPVYRWCYFSNKGLLFLWKLVAVTIAAQILTTPLSLYYFHQFPLLFIITNVVAVPLSSLVLCGEILLCAVSFIPPVAKVTGNIITWLIQCLNSLVTYFDSFSFATWQGISINVIQTALLFVFICSIAYWLMQKRAKALWIAAGSLLFFMAIRTFSFVHAGRQKKLIVYNINRHQAIDIVDGRTALFIGDTAVTQNKVLMRYNIEGARTAYRIKQVQNGRSKALRFYQKSILIIDESVSFKTFSNAHADVVVLSHNPKLNISDLAAAVKMKQVVIDASVPAWKAKLWQQDCAALAIPCYNVAQKGAFVINW